MFLYRKVSPSPLSILLIHCLIRNQKDYRQSKLERSPCRREIFCVLSQNRQSYLQRRTPSVFSGFQQTTEMSPGKKRNEPFELKQKCLFSCETYHPNHKSIRSLAVFLLFWKRAHPFQFYFSSVLLSLLLIIILSLLC